MSDPDGCLWGEWDATRPYLLAFFLGVSLILKAFTIDPLYPLLCFRTRPAPVARLQQSGVHSVAHELPFQYSIVLFRDSWNFVV